MLLISKNLEIFFIFYENKEKLFLLILIILDYYKKSHIFYIFYKILIIKIFLVFGKYFIKN